MTSFTVLCIFALIGLMSFLIAGRRLKWWWKGILAALLSISIGWLLVPGGRFLGGPSTAGGWPVLTPYREAILFVVMLTGMMARMLSLAIEKRRAALDAAPNASVSLHIDRWEFVYPTLVAVPTFGAVLGQFPSGGLDVPILALAFQNGFFWQTILKRSDGRT